jgi:subtilisin family serine protease
LSHEHHSPDYSPAEDRWSHTSRSRRRTDPATARRHHRRGRICPAVDLLEPRTLLSVSLEQTPGQSPSQTAAAVAASTPQETLDVQLKPGDAGALAQLMPLLCAAGATVTPSSVASLIQVSLASAQIGALLSRLSTEPSVQYAAPMQMMRIAEVPNDPDFLNGDQWALNGVWGIDAPAAWNTTTGSDTVVVADVDSGIDYNHPDLYDNVWINQAEIPKSVRPNLTDVNGDGVISFSDLNNPINQGSGRISDTNGDGIITGADLLAPMSSGGWADGSTQDGATAYPDDLIGWNFVNNTNNPMKDNGHGVHTAGIIGAVGNNGIGVAGTNWNVSIMPVEFLDSTGAGSDTAAAESIDYAVDHGAKVINASWGASGMDSTIAAAIQYADSKGVIIVAAAGNSTQNDDTTWFSPASYSVDYANMISVAAISSNGALASFSNYGIKSVQLAAPGVNILSTLANDTYGYLSGTSMAAPYVTGTVALVEAAHPTWSMSQVIDAVLDHTTPDPSLAGKVTTGGVVNAAAAVANTNGPRVTAATPSGAITGSSGFSTVELTFDEEVNPATFTAASITLRGPSGTITGVSVSAVVGSNDHKFNILFPTQTAAGTYTLVVSPTVRDWYGNAMNQNGNGINGQAADAFTDTIYQAAAGSSDLLQVATASIATAGTAQNITVTALAPGGKVDTSYTGTIHFTSTDPSLHASLPANFTFTAANDGTYTFTAGLTLVTAGAQSVIVADTAKPAIIGAAEDIWVDPTSASSLQLSGLPSPDVGSTSQSFTVTAMDPYGNVATGYTGTIAFTSTDPKATLPGNFTFTAASAGTQAFSAVLTTPGTQSITATDTTTGTIKGTESVSVVAPTSAVFVAQNTRLEGNWIGTYGSQGYELIGGPASLPSYATVTPSGATLFTWFSNTTDPRALAIPNRTGGIAACWTSPTSFTVDVNLNDGLTHDLELYFLDWGTTTRVEQVKLSSAATGTVLDTETVSSFHTGVYLEWKVSGNVLITITKTGGNNAVLSGLFLDLAPTSAVFLAQNTTKEGNWIGTYGTQGYDLIGGPASLPSYATITPSGQTLFTWSSNTTDPRALEIPNSTGGIAACWYSTTSFMVDVNLTDGLTHDLELYFLDWGTTTRVEQVTLSNAATGSVLDTETVSSFHTGVYLQWMASGNVLITIKLTGGNNAVLSGIFLDPTAPAAGIMGASDGTPVTAAASDVNATASTGEFAAPSAASSITTAAANAPLGLPASFLSPASAVNAGIAPIPDPGDGPPQMMLVPPPVRGKWTVASRAPGFKRSFG